MMEIIQLHVMSIPIQTPIENIIIVVIIIATIHPHIDLIQVVLVMPCWQGWEGRSRWILKAGMEDPHLYHQLVNLVQLMELEEMKETLHMMCNLEKQGKD